MTGSGGFGFVVNPWIVVLVLVILGWIAWRMVRG
jgi:hypothetical protein